MTLVSYEQLLRAPCREPDHVSPIDGVSEPDWRWYPGASAAAADPVKLGSCGERADRGSAQVLVLVIHGGCWSEAFDRTHLMPFCTYLSGRVRMCCYQSIGDVARLEQDGQAPFQM